MDVVKSCGNNKDIIVDNKKYFAFKCDDIVKAQDDIETMRGYAERCIVAIDLAKDSFILSKHGDVPSKNTLSNTFFEPIDINKNGDDILFWFNSFYISMPRDIKKWIIIDTEIERLLLKNNYVTPDDVDLIVCNNLEPDSNGVYNVLAGTYNAISFVGQVVDVEYLRLHDSFDTAVRGLYAYGTVVDKTDELFKMVCRISEDIQEESICHLQQVPFLGLNTYPTMMYHY